jgi:hypothetical protein
MAVVPIFEKEKGIVLFFYTKVTQFILFTPGIST